LLGGSLGWGLPCGVRFLAWAGRCRDLCRGDGLIPAALVSAWPGWRLPGPAGRHPAGTPLFRTILRPPPWSAPSRDACVLLGFVVRSRLVRTLFWTLAAWWFSSASDPAAAAAPHGGFCPPDVAAAGVSCPCASGARPGGYSVFLCTALHRWDVTSGGAARASPKAAVMERSLPRCGPPGCCTPAPLLGGAGLASVCCAPAGRPLVALGGRAGAEAGGWALAPLAACRRGFGTSLMAGSAAPGTGFYLACLSAAPGFPPRALAPLAPWGLITRSFAASVLRTAPPHILSGTRP